MAFLLTTVLLSLAEQESPSASAREWRAIKNCGVNSLYLLLRTYGCSVEYDQLERRLSPGPAGSSLVSLKNVAREYGLRVEICKATSLSHCAFPVIAHVEAAGVGHFVLLTSANDETVSFIDGSLVIYRTVSHERFSRDWSGYVLVVRDDGCSWLWPAGGAVLLCVLLIGKKVRWRYLTTAPWRLGLLLTTLLIAPNPSVADGSLPSTSKRVLETGRIDVLSLSWEDKYVPLVSKQEFEELFFAKWGLFRPSFQGSQYSMSIKGAEKYAARMIPAVGGQLAETSVTHDLVYLRGPGGGGQILNQTYQERFWSGTGHTLFSHQYFDMAGYNVPDSFAARQEFVEPLLLYLDRKGAPVKVVKETAETLLVDAPYEDWNLRFLLDKTKNLAVLSQEKRKNEQLLFKVDNRSFRRLERNGHWLPMAISVVWHGWRHQSYLSPRPLVREEFSVTRLSEDALSEDTFVFKYKPGEWLGDSRIEGAADAPNGVVDYVVPARKEDVERAVEEARVRLAEVKRKGWGVTILLVITAITGAYLLYRYLRSRAEVPKP